MGWWDDYKQAFLKGINPVDNVLRQYDENSAQANPIPAPTPPTPDRWYRNNVPHPLFPVPQQGAPADFSGPVIPNPNNVRVLPDTQMPADALNSGQLSTDNFRGQVPLRKLLAR